MTYINRRSVGHLGHLNVRTSQIKNLGSYVYR